MSAYRTPLPKGCVPTSAKITATARSSAWVAGGHRNVMGTMIPEPLDDPSAEDGPQSERHQRHHRGADGEALCPGDRKTEENDVARHVGDEDVAQEEIAEGIDQAGDDGHGDQEWREWTEGRVPLGDQGLADLGEECRHVQGSPLRMVTGPEVKAS